MLGLLAITGPIYIIIALGFATRRLGLFSKSDMRVPGAGWQLPSSLASLVSISVLLWVFQQVPEWGR